MKNLIVATTTGMWGIVIVEIAVLLFLNLFPQKRGWIGTGFAEKQNRLFKMLRGIMMFWILILLLAMTIQVCSVMIRNYKMLSSTDLERLETIILMALTFFSIVLPIYVSFCLIPKIFKKEG